MNKNNFFDNILDSKHPADYYSVLSCAKRGVDKSVVLSKLTTVWELRLTELIYCEVTHYYIKQWSGHFLQQQLDDGLVTLEDTGKSGKRISYRVIYDGCTAQQAIYNPQVLLSFRASPYGNYCIVQLTRRQPYRPRTATLKQE